MKKILLSLLVSVVSLSATAGWVKTDLASIKATDVVVIVDEKGNYAMSNNNGTSNPPAGVVLTIANNKITSEVADNLKWNIVADGGNYTIYPNGTTETWLYCTNTNKGVRVGTNANKVFTFESTHLKHTATSRYLGVYTTIPDWRCYTSSTEPNIKDTKTAFYVYTEGDDSGEGGGEEPGDDPVEPEIPTKGDTYRLVTSDSELEANEKYIIVAAESNYAMSTTQKDKNRGQNLITKNGNLITLSGDNLVDVQVFTLEEGTIDDTWAFYAPNYKDKDGKVQNGGYLYAAGGTSSNNFLRTKNNKDEVASAIIAVSTEGIASIVFQGEVSRNTLKYNSSSSLFSCYASGQTDVSLYKYIKTVATPVISINGDDMISITCATEGATIYYTIDGTTPTTSSTQYTDAFKLEGGATVKAIAVKDGWKNSATATVTFEQVATPEISIDDDDMISITCATEGATIYYTTNGNDPTTSSTRYTEAFKLNQDATVKAIAVKAGLVKSAVANVELTTAIEEVGVDAGEAVYYNLQGVKVANPENGIFIKKQGGRTSKVVL